MHSQRSVRWGAIEEAGSLAFLNMERDAPWTAWSKMLQLREDVGRMPTLLEDTGGPHRPTGERQKM